MKKLIPVAMAILLAAAAFWTLGNGPRRAQRTLPESREAARHDLPSSSERPLAAKPTSTTTEAASADTRSMKSIAVPATLAPSAEQVPAEDELLRSYGTEGTTAETLADLGWYPSQTWTVEVWTYRMQDGDRGAWEETPTLWRFQVQGREVRDGRDAWVLSVEPADLTGLPFNPGGRVWVAVDDHSLLALEDRVQANGEVHERTVSFDEGETGTLGSLLPVELPPAGTEGRGRKTEIGVLPPSALRVEPKYSAPKASGKVIDMEFEADGTTVRQRWDAACPYWPLYSRSASRVCVLR